mgnify:CR=1 FL=1
MAEQIMLIQQRQQLAEVRNKQRETISSLESIKKEYNRLIHLLTNVVT